MAYFAIEIIEERKRVIFLESPNEDQAGTDWQKGKEVWLRHLQDDITKVVKLTQAQFENQQIPEDFK